MINYRIRKCNLGFFATYHPQRGFLGFWWDMCDWPDGFVCYGAAKVAICNYKQRGKVEYLEVSCEDTSNQTIN